MAKKTKKMKIDTKAPKEKDDVKRKVKKREAREDENETKKQIGAILFIISAIYICFFVNLHFFYDWDTVALAIKLKNGVDLTEEVGASHFLVPILSGSLAAVFNPLSAFKILTAVLMLVFIMSAFKFTYDETEDTKFALLTALFLLFNFGFTFLLTSLEDNIWMYAFLMPFMIFLFKEKWHLSALFLALAILVHIQAEIFVLIFISYVFLKAELFRIFKNPGDISNLIDLAKKNRNYIVSTVFLLLIPIFTFSLHALVKGIPFQTLISTLTVSGYHKNPEWWYFASDRDLWEQLQLAYAGLVSVFVCRYPEYPQIMPEATYLGAFFLLLLAYTAARGFQLNSKVLCILPTFVLMCVHSLFYESWNIERWDFLPFFFILFVTITYSKRREHLHELMLVLVLISAIFTFVSFDKMSGFHANPIYVYADKLSDMLDEDSIALETIRSTSELGLYIKYKCGENVIFLEEPIEADIFNKKQIYASYITYTRLAKMLPVEMQPVWINEFNRAFSIVQLNLKTKAG